jgi:hypothetical protein
MATDYTEKWPKLAPQWCHDEIANAASELADMSTPLTHERAQQLKQRIAILQRVKADYEAMFSA